MTTIPLNSVTPWINRLDCESIISQALAAQDFPIVFDCASVHLDSGLIDYIIKVRGRAEAAGGDVEIINADEFTKETLSLVGITNLVKVQVCNE